MKRSLSLLLLLFSVCTYGQNKRVFFKLSDTVFQVGSIYTGCTILPQEKSVLRPEEQPCLDSIVSFMFSHPGMQIEIGCHTDFYGSDTFNVRISQNHANTIKRYFVSRGISSYDLAAVGYGESRLLNNETCIKEEPDAKKKDELHIQNRRTEFKILRAPYPAFTLSSSVFRVGEMMQPDLNYDLSKCTVRPECYPWLDSLADFLKKHPNLTIEIANHTDNRGSDPYNAKLTVCRSNSVALYLFTHGVDSAQVVPVGYGESQPVVSEAYINAVPSKQGKDELYQINRRTEIRIVRVD